LLLLKRLAVRRWLALRLELRLALSLRLALRLALSLRLALRLPLRQRCGLGTTNISRRHCVSRRRTIRAALRVGVPPMCLVTMTTELVCGRPGDRGGGTETDASHDPAAAKVVYFLRLNKNHQTKFIHNDVQCAQRRRAWYKKSIGRR
jgi:hypothetical protein